MSNSAGFALHRPELDEPLKRGEAKILGLMSKSVRRLGPNETLINANTEHDYVYRVREGWAGRIRRLDDGRAQFILISFPGPLPVKSMFVTRHPDAVQTLSDAVLEQMITGACAMPTLAMRMSPCTIWQILEEERQGCIRG